jgi:hypothetical protein
MKGKDFNLFEVYKSGPSKPADSGLKAILATVLVFVMIVVGVYSAIIFIKNTTQSKIDDLNAQINSPQVMEANAKLAVQLKKNQLLKEYNDAITLAKKNFDSSRIMDSVLINKILAATPANTTARTIVINPQSMDLTYVSSNRMSPAIFAQALNKQNIFSTISYDGVSIDGENTSTTPNANNATKFIFTLRCEFKEVTAK